MFNPQKKALQVLQQLQGLTSTQLNFTLEYVRYLHQEQQMKKLAEIRDEIKQAGKQPPEKAIKAITQLQARLKSL